MFDFFDPGLRPPSDDALPRGPTSQGVRSAPKKAWAPPPTPGLTLRQRVEKKEQEAGLRCCDVSCGVGPSDEDPWLDVVEQQMKQLRIRSTLGAPSDRKGVSVSLSSDGSSASASGGADKRSPLCPHTFHSSCLVSAERVALALRDAEVAFVGPHGKEEVEVSCPVCRSVGRVSKEEWNEGVRALS